jgi:hypothetical protein
MNAARREAHGGTPAPETEVNEEDGMAKKLIMLSLEALLTEFREQKVAIVWVAPVTTHQSGIARILASPASRAGCW